MKGVRLAQQRVFSKKPTSERQGQWGVPVHLERAERDRVRTDLEPDRISVSFNGSAVCVDGVGAPGAREVDLSREEIDVTIDLGVGAASASIRTTDLSHAYVEENSAYSS